MNHLDIIRCNAVYYYYCAKLDITQIINNTNTLPLHPQKKEPQSHGGCSHF